MADTATQEVEQTSAAENTAGESQTQEQTNNASQETSNDASGEQGGAKADQSASIGDDNKPSKSQDAKPETHNSRRSSRFMARRIEKLAQENANLKRERQQQDQNEWDDENTAQDDSKPNISEIVAREVKRHLDPVISESTKTADEAEISELFSGNKKDERTKYEGKIREMWKLPQYKDVAASDLYKITSFDDAVSTAVAKAIEDYKKAEREAKDSSASGSNNTSNRTGKGGKSGSDLSDEEFLKRNERIKAGLKP